MFYFDFGAVFYWCENEKSTLLLFLRGTGAATMSASVTQQFG
jgi:hypothetical protein